MNQQEILHKAQEEYKEKIQAGLEKKQIVKRGRKSKATAVVEISKPQPQAIVKRAIPQNLEYLEGELKKVFAKHGSFDFDHENAIVNFRGGRKIHECESLSQPAQILIRCAQSYVAQSFGSQKPKGNPLVTGIMDE